VYMCDVNKGRQRNVEKKMFEHGEVWWSFLNRALHCNQMIIHTNGGMRIADMQKHNVQST